MGLRVGTTVRWSDRSKDASRRLYRRLRRVASHVRRWARRASFLLASRSFDALLPHLPRRAGGDGGVYARWARELDSEVAFWRGWIAHTPGPALEERRLRLDPETPLQDWARALVDTPLGGAVHLLDVGAGPATQLGKVWPGRSVAITAIDPLADQYNRLLARYGLQAPVPSRLGHGEQLNTLVPPDSFDLAYAINALDHSYDPLAVIRGMLRATRPGGWVALDHYVNEAEYERYAGLHQWNFCAEGDRFVIWNKERRILVNDALPGATEIRVEVARVQAARAGKDWLMVRIRKALPAAALQSETMQ